MRKLPEFRGETVWEMEEDKKMQVTALEMALHKRKEDYWKAKAKEQMAAYEAAMNREAASQREDTEVGGQRLVRQQPRAGQEQQQ